MATFEDLVQFELDGSVAMLTLNDPDRRNAMSVGLFTGLEAGLEQIRADQGVRAVVIRAVGKAFCAGFDLKAAAKEPELMGEYLRRLSGVCRGLRRLDQPVVAAVAGHAIAGGCALISSCDFVFMAAEAKAGYPVHGVGVSPAVNIPPLSQAMGDGSARSLLLGGMLIDGREAVRRGLVYRCFDAADDVEPAALAHAKMLSEKGIRVMRATKRWLGELDGSFDDERFERAMEGSVGITMEEEAVRILRERWG